MAEDDVRSSSANSRMASSTAAWAAGENEPMSMKPWIMPVVAAGDDSDAGLLQRRGVGLALVAQRVELGGDDDGGREPLERVGAQRREPDVVLGRRARSGP